MLWHGFLAILLTYLLGAAILKHNRRLNKTISDMYFDSQLNFQYIRLARFMALPMHKLSNLQSFYKSECLIKNPIFEEGEWNLLNDDKWIKRLEIPHSYLSKSS